MALLATAAALVVSGLLRSLLGNASPYFPLYVAVIFSAWCCGLSPSLLATLSGALGFFFLPRGSLALPSRADTFALLSFLIVSACIVVLGEANRRGQFARLHQANVLDAANDAIVELDPSNDTIRYWNHGAEELLRLDEGGSRGQEHKLLAQDGVR